MKPRRNVIPPQPEWVTEYARSKGWILDGDLFCDHYLTRGWLAGKTKMKDWEAAVRTWIGRGGLKPTPSNAPATKNLCRGEGCTNPWTTTYQDKPYCSACRKKARGY